MTPFRNVSRRALAVLGIAPAVIACALIFSSIGWLESLPDALAMAITSGAAIFVMAWSLLISITFQRRQDEVELASGRYAMQHGFTIGAIGVAVLLLIPPFRDGVVDGSNALSLALRGDTKPAPLLAFVAGFMTLTIAQIVGAAVMSTLWWRGKR